MRIFTVASYGHILNPKLEKITYKRYSIIGKLIINYNCKYINASYLLQKLESMTVL